MKLTLSLGVTLLCLLPITLCSQEKETLDFSSKKHQFGIQLNVNYSFDYGDANSETLQIRDGAGFGLGILYQLKLNDFFALRPQATIYFSDLKRQFNEFDLFGSIEGDVFLSFPLHFIFQPPSSSKLKPKAFTGLRFNYEITNEKEGNFDAAFNNYDLAVDLGIGLSFDFKHFRFSPELSSSFGLVNILDKEQILESNEARRAIVSLRLVFQG